jgi:FlaA1/EpsC-like NDP-sugar epimerase
MKKKLRSVFLVILDIIFINLSLLLSYYIKFDFSFANIPSGFSDNLLYLALFSTVVKISFFLFFRLYTSLWQYAGAHELITVVSGALTANLAMTSLVLLSYTSLPPWLAGLSGFISIMNIPRSIFVITFLIDILFVGGIRFAYRAFRRVIKGEILKIKNYKRVLIIGGGDAGAIIIRELKHHPELKYSPIAIIDDDEYKQGKKINGIPIVGYSKDILDVILRYRIDEIIIAIPSASKRKINDIYDKCSKTDCKVKILPSVSELIDESVVIQKIRDVNIEDLLGREPVNLDTKEISSYLVGKTIIVSGGGGSIGSELCRQISFYNPKKLIILDNYENNLYDILNELSVIHPNIEFIPAVASVRDKNRLKVIFGEHKPEVIFHAAAHKHVPLMEQNPSEAIKNNIFGTINIAECADSFGAETFVLISTDKAVNPTNIMGATKRVAEMIVQSMDRHSDTKFVAVRFGNVLGSNGSVVPLFKKQIEQGGPVTVTHPEVIRYFMTIPEAVQLVLQAGGMANGSEIFVLDMGEPVKIYELAKNLIRLSGFEPEEDIKIEFTGLRPGEKLYEELLLAEEGLTKTKNEKIYVAKPVFSNLQLLKEEIDKLKHILLNDTEKLFEYIRKIVPTYQSITKKEEVS